MSNISFTSPFVYRFTHDEGSLSTAWSEILPASVAPEKRVSVIVQNKDTSISIEIHLGLSDTVADGGINLAAGASLTLDNYKGAIQARSASGTPVVHVASAIV